MLLRGALSNNFGESGAGDVDEVVYQCKGLDRADIALLERVEASMSILADVNRADVLLYVPLSEKSAAIAAHSRPHSVSPVHDRVREGSRATEEQQPLVFQALAGRMMMRLQRAGQADGATIMQRVAPVRNAARRVIACLCVETNLIEHERHRRRSAAFQWAVICLQQMAARGELSDAATLTPFGEHDGILLVDQSYRVRYASGIATNLYRRLGLHEALVGKSLRELGTGDEDIVAPIFHNPRCIEQEITEAGRSWIKRGVPILAVTRGWTPLANLEPWLAGHGNRRVRAALILMRDTTETRQKEQELKVKTAMIREVHHRVKNNLQTIAALLRMQARRSASPEVQEALQEGINRILSVAVVHEFLAHQEEHSISLREVTSKIVRQIRQGMIDPEKRIKIDIAGPDVSLSPQQATSCALILNELLLNSIEHGFGGRSAGNIAIGLGEADSTVTISVQDDGEALPAGFDVERLQSLGLQIVRTLVQDDLKGSFQLHNADKGVRAVVQFPKSVAGGD
jgi:two-component sensor histidine kinase